MLTDPCVARQQSRISNRFRVTQSKTFRCYTVPSLTPDPVYQLVPSHHFLNCMDDKEDWCPKKVQAKADESGGKNIHRCFLPFTIAEQGFIFLPAMAKIHRESTTFTNILSHWL